MDEQQVVEAVAAALQQGMPPEQIVQGLVNEVGLEQGQAEQLVQQVASEMGGEQGGQEGGGQGGITAEQAMQAFEQLQVPPDMLLQIIDIILSMSPQEIDKLAQVISQAGGGGEQAPTEQAPPTEEAAPEEYAI